MRRRERKKNIRNLNKKKKRTDLAAAGDVSSRARARKKKTGLSECCGSSRKVACARRPREKIYKKELPSYSE